MPMNHPGEPRGDRERRRAFSGIPGLAASALGSLLLAAMAGVAVIHWGGAYPHVGAQVHLGGALLWIITAVMGVFHLRARRGGPDAIDGCVALFLVYAAWTYARTPVEYAARLEWSWVLTYAAAFAFVRYGLPSRQWAMALIGVVVLAALASCIYAFIHRENPTHLIWGLPRPNYGARVSGTFGCPNHFANLMVMATLSCLFLGAYSRFAWPLRIFLFYLAAVLTAGLYLSVSRGGYIAWLAGMIVVAWCLFRTPHIRWWWKAAISVLVAAGTTLVILKNPFVMERLDRMMEGDIRIKLAQISVKLWEAAPVWGHGIGAYDYVYLRAHGPDLQLRALYAHCDYLNTLVDYGAVGLTLVLLFVLAVSVQLFRRGKADPHERELILLRLGWAALAAMAVHSVFDFSLHLPGCALAFFIILGASVMRTPREERNGAGGGAALAGWALFLLGALAAAATLAPMAWKTLQGQRLGRIPEAALLSMGVPELDAAGERLFAVDPGADPLIVRFGDALRVKAAEAAAAIDSAAPGDLPGLYRAREEAGRLALKYYQRAHRAAPLEDTLLVKQAMTLDVLQRYAEAYLAYARAVELQPDNRYFRFNFGMHLVETGQYAAAVEQLRHAVHLPVNEREGPALRNSARTALEYIQSRLSAP